MALIIRAETENDREAIRDVNARAFGRENEARLIDLLRTSGSFLPELSLVAVSDESVDQDAIAATERVTGGSKPPAESQQSPPRGLQTHAIQPLQRAFSASAGRFDRPATQQRGESTHTCGRVVGHILFTRIHIRAADRDVPALALAPLAVHPDCQNQGIGSALVRRGLEDSRRLGHAIVVVVGHPKYYPRFGFVSARAKGLEAPFNDAAFMVQELRAGALDGVRGTVEYPPAFAEV